MPPVIRLLPPQQGIHFDEPSHRYHVWSPQRGRWMQPSSVSQALTVSGIKGFDSRFWRKSLIEKHGMRSAEADLYMELHRNNRAAIGTELHGLIQAELLGGNFWPKLAESLMLFAVWRRKFLPEVEEVYVCESPMASGHHFYTGTPDLLARVRGQLLWCDWKSKVSADKAKADKAWLLQLTGYDGLGREHHAIVADGALNLMIHSEDCSNKGDCIEVFYNRADLDQAWPKFLGAVYACHCIRGQEGDADSAAAAAHLLATYPAIGELVPAAAGS